VCVGVYTGLCLVLCLQCCALSCAAVELLEHTKEKGTPAKHHSNLPLTPPSTTPPNPHPISNRQVERYPRPPPGHPDHPGTLRRPIRAPPARLCLCRETGGAVPARWVCGHPSAPRLVRLRVERLLPGRVPVRGGPVACAHWARIGRGRAGVVSFVLAGFCDQSDRPIVRKPLNNDTPQQPAGGVWLGPFLPSAAAVR